MCLQTLIGDMRRSRAVAIIFIKSHLQVDTGFFQGSCSAGETTSQFANVTMPVCDGWPNGSRQLGYIILSCVCIVLFSF